MHTSRDRLRRLINVVVALVGIVVTAPLLLLVAVVVKLDSRGPAIYRQPRVGLDRRGDRESIEDVKKKVELDLEYIGRRSATEDLAIMARTMPVMVFRRVWM